MCCEGRFFIIPEEDYEELVEFVRIRFSENDRDFKTDKKRNRMLHDLVRGHRNSVRETQYKGEVDGTQTSTPAT